MTKHKWTPGPWKEAKDAQGTCGLIHPKKRGVAVAWFSDTFLPAHGFVGDEECELGRPERQANANLISAAPDMAEALEDSRAELCGLVYELRARTLPLRNAEMLANRLEAIANRHAAALRKADGAKEQG